MKLNLKHIVSIRKNLIKICKYFPDRSTGSETNRRAGEFIMRQFDFAGWNTRKQEFDALDWQENGARLSVNGSEFIAFPSPYSRGCNTEAELISVSSISELERAKIRGKLVLLHNEIAAEQLMPKSFKFYNPEQHQHIISLLERGAPQAIICATGRNAAAAGGVYPFPLIEDGDFNIPSVYMTEEQGKNLLNYLGQPVNIISDCKRIPGKGFNVVAEKGPSKAERIVITAHYDAKKGTPGAIDNATGVVILLLLAGLLTDYHGKYCIELAAFNGEDYYSVPGQMLYLRENQERFGDILLNINIDGAGYKEGPSAYSFYELPNEIKAKAEGIFAEFCGLTSGDQWVQGDHSIFVQNGCPAIAFSSQWFIEHIDTQTITHTPADNPDIVEPAKCVEIAEAMAELITELGT